ncbi:MAG: DUF4406 domain-containing protein [Rhodospirillaceae bacterium]|jgi:hypothetical protein|nr:DUF4406 domain-containing protein [Rhodospirillaceae bacterium]MBT6512059.1 DUF4406 domain-containing protein [Rhodospirillaceae bacterium]MBT7612442.1 DUF4406 domain-containing protein [Rhodospirillaceae bacterium]
MWIMVAGPFGSTATDEQRSINQKATNAAALAVWKKGHVPVIGVNNALPMIEVAGVEHYEALMMPMSLALAERCDTVLRIGGVSGGADREVDAIVARGGLVYRDIGEVPEAGR